LNKNEKLIEQNNKNNNNNKIEIENLGTKNNFFSIAATNQGQNNVNTSITRQYNLNPVSNQRYSTIPSHRVNSHMNDSQSIQLNNTNNNSTLSNNFQNNQNRQNQHSNNFVQFNNFHHNFDQNYNCIENKSIKSTTTISTFLSDPPPDLQPLNLDATRQSLKVSANIAAETTLHEDDIFSNLSNLSNFSNFENNFQSNQILSRTNSNKISCIGPTAKRADKNHKGFFPNQINDNNQFIMNRNEQIENNQNNQNNHFSSKKIQSQKNSPLLERKTIPRMANNNTRCTTAQNGVKLYRNGDFDINEQTEGESNSSIDWE
jgi:hypothetical protein